MPDRRKPMLWIDGRSGEIFQSSHAVHTFRPRTFNDDAVPRRSLPPYPVATVIEIGRARGFDLPKRRAMPVENFFAVHPRGMGGPSLVGWAKAKARPCFTMKPRVRRAHHRWRSLQ